MSACDRMASDSIDAAKLNFRFLDFETDKAGHIFLVGVAEDALKDEAKSRVEDKIRSKLGDRLKGLIK